MEGEGPPEPPGGPAPSVLVFLPDGAAVPLAPEQPAGASAAELLRLLLPALRLPPAALRALALWLVSPLLEVQLKPKHQPFRLCRQWPELLLRFSDASDGAIARDEPCLQLRRSVFFPKDEELEDAALLRLLYEDARCHAQAGRYPCSPEDGAALGALICRLRLGPFDERQHSARALRPLLREVPRGARAAGGLLGALRWGGPRAEPPERRLLEAFRAAPGAAAAPPDLHRDFLRRCHRLPAYGSAFFPGSIDRPPGGLLSRGGRRAVSVAVGLGGVTILDPREQEVLLALTLPELSWELVGAGGAPGDEAEAPSGPPELWLEFDGDHEGAPVNRLLRVRSPQAELMSALIECCIALGGGAGPPRPPPLQSQDSVTRPRLQRLNTIDYVEDGQELRRVKPPRRSVSFFGRSLGPGGAAAEPS
ncbi:FERM domain-containing protein 8 [Eudromia elegans]